MKATATMITGPRKSENSSFSGVGFGNTLKLYQLLCLQMSHLKLTTFLVRFRKLQTLVGNKYSTGSIKHAIPEKVTQEGYCIFLNCFLITNDLIQKVPRLFISSCTNPELLNINLKPNGCLYL